MSAARGLVRSGAFTLIEVLVVLAIVSTLLLLVTPRYFDKVDATKEAVLRLTRWRSGRACSSERNGGPSSASESMSPEERRRFSRPC